MTPAIFVIFVVLGGLRRCGSTRPWTETCKLWSEPNCTNFCFGMFSEHHCSRCYDKFLLLKVCNISSHKTTTLSLSLSTSWTLGFLFPEGRKNTCMSPMCSNASSYAAADLWIDVSEVFHKEEFVGVIVLYFVLAHTSCTTSFSFWSPVRISEVV